jgi:anti-sigma factor RsiW
VSAHERWDDAAAGYLLGALPEPERAEFEAHLEGCPACREEHASLRELVDGRPPL